MIRPLSTVFGCLVSLIWMMGGANVLVGSYVVLGRKCCAGFWSCDWFVFVVGFGEDFFFFCDHIFARAENLFGTVTSKVTYVQYEDAISCMGRRLQVPIYEFVRLSGMYVCTISSTLERTGTILTTARSPMKIPTYENCVRIFLLVHTSARLVSRYHYFRLLLNYSKKSFSIEFVKGKE